MQARASAATGFFEVIRRWEAIVEVVAFLSLNDPLHRILLGFRAMADRLLQATSGGLSCSLRAARTMGKMTFKSPPAGYRGERSILLARMGT